MKKNFQHILFLSVLTVFFPVMSVSSHAMTGNRIILSSVFPVYQVVRNITEGSACVEVRLMLPSVLGCPHDYIITPGDINEIRHADVIVVNGLGLDDFILDTVKKIRPDVTVIDCSENADGLIPVDSRQNHDHSGHSRHNTHNTVYNPHTFVSPGMAGKAALNIAAALAAEIPSEASLFTSNGEKYKKKMETLAEIMTDSGKHILNRRIVVQHDIFDYMARDMGLVITGVIQDHPGQDPSPAQTIRLVKKIKEENAGAILTEPQYPAKLGQMIAKETNIPVIEIDPVAGGPDNAGLDYFETVMSHNIKIVMEVLGEK